MAARTSLTSQRWHVDARQGGAAVFGRGGNLPQYAKLARIIGGDHTNYI